MTPELALQDALAIRLKADASVRAFVAGRIFDEIPGEGIRSNPAPYLYLGPMGRTRIDFDCGQAWTIQARFYAISNTFGRRQLWSLIEAVVQCLDGLDDPILVLASPFKLQEAIRIQRAGDVVDPLSPKSAFVDLSTTITRNT